MLILKNWFKAQCRCCGKKLSLRSARKELCDACAAEGEKMVQVLNSAELLSPVSSEQKDPDFFDLSSILGSLQVQETRREEAAVFSNVLLTPRKMPVRALVMSTFFHLGTITLLVGITSIPWDTSFHITREMLERDSTITYYRPSDLLPRMSSPKPGPKDAAGRRKEVKAAKGSTSYHQTQTVQSSPLKPDNPTQTVVQPKTPETVIKKELKLPNIVIWNVEEHKLDSLDLASKKAALRDMTLPTPLMKVVDPEMKNVERSLAEMKIAETDPLNLRAKLTLRPASSPEWAIGRDSAKAEEMINVPGGKGAGPMNNLLVLSANPGLPTPGSLDVPAGQKTGAFSISPEGNRIGSPDGLDEGYADGGVHGGGGSGGNGSGYGGGRDIAQIQIPGISVKSGPQIPSPGVVGGGKRGFTEMVTLEEPVDSYNITIMEGRSGGAGLGVYGVLTGRRNYTVFIPMPGGRWIMQFSEMPSGSESASAGQSVVAQGQIAVGMGEAIMQPRAFRKVDPGRPEDEELAKLRGIAVLFAIIRRDGSVDKVRVVRSLNPMLDQRAVEALKKWKFKPASLGSDPVEVQALFGVPFRPRPI
jgi:TonB family protein